MINQSIINLNCMLVKDLLVNRALMGPVSNLPLLACLLANKDAVIRHRNAESVSVWQIFRYDPLFFFSVCESCEYPLYIKALLELLFFLPSSSRKEKWQMGQFQSNSLETGMLKVKKKKNYQLKVIRKQLENLKHSFLSLISQVIRTACSCQLH